MEMVFHTSRAADCGDSQPELQALGWAELCARIGAAQDLRRVLTQDDATLALAGSFHRNAARVLARRTESEDAVNLNPSGDGKDGQAIHDGEPGLASRPGLNSRNCND